MSREKQLFKNTAIITIGKICTQLVSFFLLPIYTAILTTEEYGVVDLLNTIVSLLLPIITFQIEQAVFRHLIDVRDDNQEKTKIITSTILTILLQSIIYLVMLLLISKFINNEYKYFLVTNVIAAIFSSVFLQISRGLGDNKTYAVGSFIVASATIIFNVIFIVKLHMGAYGMLLASLLSNAICAIYIFIRKHIYRFIKIKQYSITIVKKLWKYSIPLIPNSISWWIFNSSDRIIVSSVLGMGQTGILATAHKFPNVYITIFNMFNITWTESAALHIRDNDSTEYFNKIINKMFGFFASISLGIIACMPFVFPFLLNEAYGEAYYQIPISMLAAIANVGIGLVGVVYVANKKTKEIAKISISAATINIIVHIALIKFIGLYAATISTFVSYWSMFLYRIYDIRKKYMKISLEKNVVISTLITSVMLLITYYINVFSLNIVALVITIIYAYYINKDNLNFILNIIKKH